MDRSVGVVSHTSGDRYVYEQLTMGVSENIFGLGERFGAFVKNGQVVDVWNEDGGTASEQAYKNVPFYLSDAGYGVFIDTPTMCHWKLGLKSCPAPKFRCPDQDFATSSSMAKRLKTSCPPIRR